MRQQPETAGGRGVRIIGVPMDLGQQRRGVDMGPSALRYAGMQAHLEHLGYEVTDEGNINVPVPEASTETITGVNGLRHLPAIEQVTQELYTRAAALAAGPDTPIFLGGDHSIALGTVAGTGSVGTMGLLWIDAHADFNTPETTPSGNIHGMPVAALLGRGAASLTEIGRRSQLKPAQIVMIGVRDLDLEERRQLKQSGITVFTMREIDEQGMARIARRVLDRLAAFPRLHISLDM
ncbi:MAG: arginase, partial [Anaerolineae bacterium]